MGRKRWGLAVVAVALVLSPTPTAPADTEPVTDTTPPVVHSPSPAPGAMVRAGDLLVDVRVRSPHAIASAHLHVGGRTAEDVTIGPRDDSGEVAVSGAVTVGPGEHPARVEVKDAAGRRSERVWTFTATDYATARLAGDSRYDTAVAISAATFPDEGSAAAAVLARADDFADALAGAPLAVAVDGPLLLAGRGSLPASVAAELQRALEPGATVHLLGGTAALPEAVAREVEDLGFPTVRHAGDDRYATGAQIARELPGSPRAIVASGTSFPDALAASSPAARDGIPVLLTPAERLAGSTAAVLAERDVSWVTVVGGETVVAERTEAQLREHVERVDRLAGPDRYATAAAVLEAFYDEPAAVSLASGREFPDALTGTRHAASRSQPLLLTHPRVLLPVTEQTLRAHRPPHLTVYGGSAAVAEQVESTARQAAIDGPHAPRVIATTPAFGDAVPYLDEVVVTLDRPVDPARSSLYVTLDDVEVAGAVAESAPSPTLTFRFADEERALALDQPHAGRILLSARDGAGVGHAAVAFTYREPDPVFTAAGGVPLHLPSRNVEMVGFHQANHRGAQQMDARDTATPKTTLPGRDRETASRSAADVVASPDLPVLAPVTGRVVRAGSYVLYCRHADHFAVIEPDDRPGWEVKVLHFHGLRVQAGDRVTAFQTVVGEAPRTLPFSSQVDERSDERNWPHVHLEVVDPSVPNPPGPGC